MIREIVALTKARRAGDGWLGVCVAHDDKTPSLSIAERDGKILLRCFTGCSFDQLRDALKSRGIDLGRGGDKGWETVYKIRDIDGKVIAQHVRLDKADGKKVWWLGPKGEKKPLKDLGLKMVDLPLYLTETLKGLKRGSSVFVTEGEKAAAALVKMGLTAVGTVTGASYAPSAKALGVLHGFRVFLWPDNDEPGVKHMNSIAATLRAMGTTHETFHWPDAPKHGDAADFYAMGGTKDQLRELVSPAPEPKPAEAPRLRMLWEGIEAARDGLDRFERADFRDRVPVGMKIVDERLRGGMPRGVMILLGAPTGGGKTTLVQQIASRAARTGPVLLVTPEMDLVALAEREIIRESGREAWDRNPWGYSDLTRTEAREEHHDAAGRILREQLPLYVLDKTDTNMGEIEDVARSIPDLKLVVIDYAQEVAGDPEQTDAPRYIQVGEVATRAVALSRELGCPVLVASQVNVEKRGKFKSYTFRESEILSHKAHTILIFDVEWKPDDRGHMQPSDVKILCTKNRSGPTFRVDATYEPKLFQVRVGEVEASDFSKAARNPAEPTTEPPPREPELSFD